MNCQWETLSHLDDSDTFHRCHDDRAINSHGKRIGIFDLESFVVNWRHDCDPGRRKLQVCCFIPVPINENRFVNPVDDYAEVIRSEI